MKVFRRLTYACSALNVLLAFIVFPIVPLLGWLNYGHGNWVTSWIPEAVLLIWLPAAYYLYWHYWFVAAIPALAGSLYLIQRTANRSAKMLAVANAGAVVWLWAVRIAMGVLNIRPDIV